MPCSALDTMPILIGVYGINLGGALFCNGFSEEMRGLFEHGILRGNPTMLTDTKLSNLKPKDKLYKVNDRDGLYHHSCEFDSIPLQLLDPRQAGDYRLRPLRCRRNHASGSRWPHPKLDEQPMQEIKALLRDPSIQVTDVARHYSVSRTTFYKHVGVVALRK